tara:strand:- start:721 stop:1023 length:303 start_codon:yes stop_codon:yes gene_type:complete
MSTFPYAGSISHGTLRPEDLIPAFLSVLSDLDPASAAKIRRRFYPFTEGWYDSEEALWALEDLFDALDACAPKNYLFGSHEGDCSDFGFWQAPQWGLGQW